MGEAAPVSKIASPGAPPVRPGADDLPYIYSGSLVVRGHGRAEVTATGPRGEIGKIGLAVTRMDTEPPRLRVQITGCFFWAIEPLAFYKPCSRTGAALYVIIGAMPCRFLHGL